MVGFWLASVPSQVLTMWLSQGRLVLHVVILYVTGAETLFCGNLAASPTFFKHATGYGVLTGHVTRTLRATLLSLGYKLGNKHINDTKVMQLPAEIQLGLRGSQVQIYWGVLACTSHQYSWVLHMSSDSGVAPFMSHADCDAVWSQALTSGPLTHSLPIQCCF